MKKTFVRILLTFAILVPLLANCSDDDKPMNGGEPPDTIRYLVPLIVRSIPHNNFLTDEASTQGLLYHDGILYESNGGAESIAKTNIRTIDPVDGTILKRVFLYASFPLPDFNPCAPSRCFGEGIALRNGRIVQLVWINQRTLEWSVPGLDYQGIEFTYRGQGWGLANTDSCFIMSNGSDTLYFRDDTFAITNRVPVTYHQEPLDSLNELEHIDGLVYANVYGRASIYGIDSATGVVTTVVNCSSLVDIVNLPLHERPLNGIAYDDSTGYFYVTGKEWPLIFEVLFVEEE